MPMLALAVSLAAIAWVLWDAFEVILLPRRVPARGRISRWLTRALWAGWSAIARRLGDRTARENLLATYALVAVLGLFATWAGALIVAFAGLYWACGSPLRGIASMHGFAADLYLSGSSFFTLGIGDLQPTSNPARLITVAEAGTGLAFLALIIAYVPVLYQAFARREARITMLDEWSGSPPTAAVLLRRWSESADPEVLTPLLKDWEQTAAEILESHLTYPILCFFRSQHDNQSWLASLTAILDTCALVIVGIERADPFQARLTYAIGRHALVDVSQALRVRPDPDPAPVDPREWKELEAWLARTGVPVATGDDAMARFSELRALYLAYARPLSQRLLMPLAPLLPPERTRYNWETTAWARTARDDGH